MSSPEQVNTPEKYFPRIDGLTIIGLDALLYPEKPEKSLLNSIGAAIHAMRSPSATLVRLLYFRDTRALATDLSAETPTGKSLAFLDVVNNTIEGLERFEVHGHAIAQYNALKERPSPRIRRQLSDEGNSNHGIKLTGYQIGVNDPFLHHSLSSVEAYARAVAEFKFNRGPIETAQIARQAIPEASLR